MAQHNMIKFVLMVPRYLSPSTCIYGSATKTTSYEEDEWGHCCYLWVMAKEQLGLGSVYSMMCCYCVSASFASSVEHCFRSLIQAKLPSIHGVWLVCPCGGFGLWVPLPWW
ncbi:hypothetical protein VNO77_16949 [Canavalia gladiata]|uniref:Uncharacterized protein n=1 Tax=Canavalia gladiata TaxID=3824 RepID=A0AAN9QIA6_CANGL